MSKKVSKLPDEENFEFINALSNYESFKPLEAFINDKISEDCEALITAI